MSWNSQVNIVRDGGFSHGYRLRALASAIEQVQPLGFTNTWAYLEARLRLSPTSKAFLEPAVDALCEEREQRLVQSERYAQLRIEEKRAGRRQPLAGGVTPLRPLRWHGDEERGARMLIGSLLDRLEPASLGATCEGRTVLAVATELRSCSDEEGLRRQDLDDDTLTALQKVMARVGSSPRWPSGPPGTTARRTRQTTCQLLEQLHLAIYGPPPLNKRLRFVSTAND